MMGGKAFSLTTCCLMFLLDTLELLEEEKDGRILEWKK